MAQVQDSFVLTGNFLSAVLKLRYRDSVGTAVRISIGESYFLLTANHLVSTLEAGDRIGLRRNDDWHLFKVTELARDLTTDLCVMSLALNLMGGLSIEQLIGSTLIPGQRVLACGFPLGFEQSYGMDDQDIPMPLVKAGVFSGIVRRDGRQERFFDLHNNVGFSGGPIYYWDLQDHAVKVAGIVSGYKYDAPNYVRERINGKETVTDRWTRDNSGYTVAFHPKELIAKFGV
ncbi:S1C family serine protease [Hyphomonas sp.]|uniref:S1 family peptidase n=1 Tax=Hyphomonas sp. TaxID=87 RepID=UPI0032421F9C